MENDKNEEDTSIEVVKAMEIQAATEMKEIYKRKLQQKILDKDLEQIHKLV